MFASDVLDGCMAKVEAEEPEASMPIDPAARAGLPRCRFRAWPDKIRDVQEITCDGPGSEAAEPAPTR